MRACFMLAKVCTPSSPVIGKERGIYIHIYIKRERGREREREGERGREREM